MGFWLTMTEIWKLFLHQKCLFIHKQNILLDFLALSRRIHLKSVFRSLSWYWIMENFPQKSHVYKAINTEGIIIHNYVVLLLLWYHRVKQKHIYFFNSCKFMVRSIVFFTHELNIVRKNQNIFQFNVTRPYESIGLDFMDYYPKATGIFLR